MSIAIVDVKAHYLKYLQQANKVLLDNEVMDFHPSLLPAVLIILVFIKISQIVTVLLLVRVYVLYKTLS